MKQFFFLKSIYKCIYIYFSLKALAGLEFKTVKSKVCLNPLALIKPFFSRMNVYNKYKIKIYKIFQYIIANFITILINEMNDYQ